jgi:hypothetical protein
MRIIALMQVYNEASFVAQCLQNRYHYVDKMVITEGLLTPFGNMPAESSDRTRELIQEWIMVHDIDKKCELLEARRMPGKTREEMEGHNKNRMLAEAKPNPGDVIHIMDADEFYDPKGFKWIVDRFRACDKIRQCWPEEWQFAYNLSWAFPSRHGSRFLRYVKGAHFGKTNHFFHGDFDLVNDRSFVVPRETSGVCHLCWAKHPSLIREKVVSFNRPSFTKWFNDIYLRWPSKKNLFGRGYAEGQREPLRLYDGHLPHELKCSFHEDHFPELCTSWEKYLI